MKGFWEPHTSSIDFCEANYVYTPYVAEMFNTVSALFMVVAGVFGWLVTPRRFISLPRFQLCWALFVAIGIGSAAFHATLRRPAQAMDEVPMVLGNLVLIYCQWSASQLADARRATLAASLLLAGMLQLVLYFVFELYAVFLSMYIGGLVVLLWKCHEVCYDAPGNNAAAANAPLLKWLMKLAFGTYGAGGAVWILDNVACSQLGMGHLHILWHATATAGTAYYILLLVACTASGQGLHVKIGSWWNMLPCLEISHEAGKKGK